MKNPRLALFCGYATALIALPACAEVSSDQIAPDSFATEFPAFVSEFATWTTPRVSEMQESSWAYVKKMKSSNFWKTPHELTSEAFFAEITKAFTVAPDSDPNTIRYGRQIISEWLICFVRYGFPRPEERIRALDAQGILLNTTTKEVNQLNSQGVSTRDAGTWNGFQFGPNGPVKMPMPEKMLKANHLSALKGMQVSLMEFIWGQFMRKDVHKAVEERKQFFFSKGITESEYRELILLLPDIERTR